MSAANMQKFFGAIGQGGDLRTRAEAAIGVPLHQLVQMDLQNAEGHIGKLVQFADKEGYGFSRDELVTAFRQQVGAIKPNGGNGELSDSDLAAVAGGAAGGWLVGAVIGGIGGGIIGGVAGGPLGAGAGVVAGVGLGGDVASNVQDFANQHKWGNW